MSDSFLCYWRGLEAIIPVKVEFVEAGLASGLLRHSHSRQASFMGRREISRRGAPSHPAAIKTSDCEGGTPYDATPRFVTAANSL